MIGLLGGTKTIKNIWFKKQGLRKSFCPLLGTHQDVGTSVNQKMKKTDRKIVFDHLIC